jgi:cysteine synthase B
VPTVRIPPVLRTSVGGQKQLEASGDTVGDVLRALVNEHPGLREQLFTGEGGLNRFVNVYVNSQDVRYLQELDTPVAAHDTVVLLPAMAGGAVADIRALPTHEEAELLRPHAHEGLGPHGGRYASIVDAIGHTPLVEIPLMCPNPNVRLYAKLEFLNPTGSVKDRVAKYLIEDLERAGRLTPDSIIVEPTSGNTGIALAMIARRKGYRVAVVLPDNVTNERRQLLALFGAEIIDSPGAKGSNGAVALAKYLVEKDERFVMPYQYGNPANPKAHEETTAAEILADCPEVDAFVAGLGTGGTLMGVARRLRRQNPDVKIYAAEPMPGENVQGLRSLDEGFVPEIFDPSLIDGKFLVSNEDSIIAMRALTEREGIFGGVSSGGALVAAARVAREMSHGTIVVLLADGGWKYLSEELWTRELDDETLESGSWW